MAYPAYLATNLITSAATITPSTVSSVYPSTGLYDGSADIPFRFTSVSGSIAIDFAAPVAADCIGVIEHNLTSGATVTLKAGTTSACSDFTQALTWKQWVIAKRFTEQTYRYWKLEITDAANTTDVFIGELIIGKSVALTFGHEYGYSWPSPYVNIVHKTVKGVRHAFEFTRERELPYRFANLSRTQLTELETLDNAVKGTLLSFLWLPDASVEEGVYGSLADRLKFENAGEGRYLCGNFVIDEEAHILTLD